MYSALQKNQIFLQGTVPTYFQKFWPGLMIFFPNSSWDDMIYDSDGSKITWRHPTVMYGVWMSNKYCFRMSVGLPPLVN